MASNPSASLKIENLRCGYGRRRILEGVSFCAESGGLTGLLGANGCGKTTLLKAICGLIPYTGSCLCGGQDLKILSGRERARRISYIPQRSGVRISLPALEVVLMGFNPVLGTLQNPSQAQRARALDALEAVGMASCASMDYQTLSEGQKQLCILARAIVEDAPLLLLDEPESALDFHHRHHIMRLLREITSHGDKAGLVTLHDPALALEYCSRLVLLKDGVCTDILAPASDNLSRMEEALSKLYGPVRLAALEDNGHRRLALLPRE